MAADFPGSGPAGRPDTPGPDVPPVPAGFRLHRDPGLVTYRDGTVLLGGSPYRLMRLGPKGAAHVRAWWQGEPVRS